MKKSLVLTGMMGVGKSSIGKAVAIKQNLNFIDIDQAIEREEKTSIKEIFEKKGEHYFREIEKKYCLNFIKKSDLVISLGGGAFIDNTIRENVLKSCTSFWLDVNVNNLLVRLKGSKKRPLLNDINPKKKLIEIFEKRKSIYNLANYRIDCNNKDENLIVKNILKICLTLK